MLQSTVSQRSLQVAATNKSSATFTVDSNVIGRDSSIADNIIKKIILVEQEKRWILELWGTPTVPSRTDYW